MPILTDQTLARLSAYKLPNRDGFDIPKPSKDMKEMACWCWALSGAMLSVKDKKSANSVYEALVQIDIVQDPPAFTGFLDVKAATALYGNGIASHVKFLKDNEAKAKGGDKTAQTKCKIALMQIMATLHGLMPTGKPGEGVDPAKTKEYTLHMRTSSWFGWDHWAIGVPLNDKRRMIIQTVTGQPLSYACTTIWDEHLPEAVIGIGTLSKAHVTEIEKIPVAAKNQAK